MNKIKYTIELFSQLEAFQLRDIGANTVKKAEKLEADFASWKKANGFDAKMDMDDLAQEFRDNIPAKELDKYYEV